MDDAAVRALARRAGIVVQWTDYTGVQRRVSLDTIRRVLATLGLPCGNADDLSHSRHLLGKTQTPPLVTATSGEPMMLHAKPTHDRQRARITLEDGSVRDVTLRATASGLTLPAIEATGYHSLEFGPTRLTLAVAPPRCAMLQDISPCDRIAGLAVQTYSLREPGDCGIGDMAGVTALADAAGALGVDALGLSPAHAPFTAPDGHYSPYSPSSRLFYDPMLANVSSIFGSARVARAAALGTSTTRDLEASSLIDWRRSTAAKMAVLRSLFDDLAATDLAPGATTALASDFAGFRSKCGVALERHAVFEALLRAQLQADPRAWNWRDWPSRWRDPDTPAVKSFAEDNRREVLFHAFLQWVADNSFAKTQQHAKYVGMRIGLIADLAVGTNPSGSDAWASARDLLSDLQVGAPADLFNPNGQNWGLTTFSPRALRDGGFAPFIAMLNSCMRHAGGARIDHAMGLLRLWVIPTGAEPSDGAYLAYPVNDLFRLIALESRRHGAIVIGEDLGTVPPGFRERLVRAGIYGTRVLWFERDEEGFAAPVAWPATAVAMTSTHDLPTVTGWWSGHDLDTRHRCGLLTDVAGERAARRLDRKTLWRAFRAAKASVGGVPTEDDGRQVVDPAVKFIAATPSQLALLPLEDALACEDQPNLPGTSDPQPNWRRRYPGEARALLDPPDVRHRIMALAERGLL
jgi:4-alpha-glucanotransferase